MISKEAKEFKAIHKKLGLPSAVLARKLKVDPKTVRNLLADRYNINPLILKRARRLAVRHDAHAAQDLQLQLATESTEEVRVPPEPDVTPEAPKPAPAPESVGKKEVPPYATPEALRKMRAALELSQREIAQYLKVNGTYYNRFERGLTKVSKRLLPAVRTLSEYVEKGDFSQQLPALQLDDKYESHWAKKRKAARGETGAGKVLALNTRFQERYREEQNQRLVDSATAFVAEEFKMRSTEIRHVVSAVLVILKDSMTPDEIIERLIVD